LALINACISHELRNPLNSIIAQNLQQRALIKALKETIKAEKEVHREGTNNNKHRLEKIYQQMKSSI
jgi:signal transduction histidine kinase